MIPEKLKEIMKKDGVAAIATLGPDGPHMVNTWNSYIRISQDERLFIPAGYMHKTEANIAHNPNVLITLGSSKIEGLHGMGAGFLITHNCTRKNRVHLTLENRQPFPSAGDESQVPEGRSSRSRRTPYICRACL